MQTIIFVIFFAVITTFFFRGDPNTSEFCSNELIGSKIQLQDGRDLYFVETGPKNGFPVFFFHPSGFSRIFHHPHLQQLTEKLNIHLITLDRPGVGRSTFHSQHSLLSWADDVDQLANHLRINKFSIIGQGSGGSHALAVATKLSHRIVKIATLGALVFPPAFGEDWNSNEWRDWSVGMRNFDKMMIKLSSGFPEIFKIVWKVFAPSLLTERNLKDVCVRPSEASMCRKDQWKQMLYDSQIESFRQGTAAYYQELMGLQHDWGFRLQDIKTPVRIWQGRYDEIASLCMAHYLQTKIPLASLKIEETGHFTLWAEHAAEILFSVLE